MGLRNTPRQKCDFGDTASARPQQHTLQSDTDDGNYNDNGHGHYCLAIAFAIAAAAPPTPTGRIID